MKRLFSFVIMFSICSILFFLTSCGSKKENKDSYRVTFNSNGGTSIESQSVDIGGRVKKPNDPTREGYTFVNWTYSGEEWSFVKDLVTSDITLDANWSINSYYLNLISNNSSAGKISGKNGNYEYNSNVYLHTSLNEGYIFDGWYIGNSLVSKNKMFYYKMGASSVTIEARYSIAKYSISINNQAEGINISGLDSANGYVLNSDISLLATNIPSDYSIKWKRSDGVVYYGNNYSFKMPSTNLTITTTAIHKIINDNKIFLGSYPQSRVTDNSLINTLNSLAGTKPTSTNLFNWIDYNYYHKGEMTNFMYYQDIDYDDDGDYDYRGVYFTKERSEYIQNSNVSYANQSKNGYLKDMIYWFSYDPIEWYILADKNDKILIIANCIIDSQEFYSDAELDSFSHNGGIGYANNYELSNIRKFLNEKFYDTAFTDLDKNKIVTSIVDNSSSSYLYGVKSEFVCNNTNDKIFLLSEKEYNELLNSNVSKGTEYAKCQGLKYSTTYNNWWLRSAGQFDGNRTLSITEQASVNNVSIGVRPACWITL